MPLNLTSLNGILTLLPWAAIVGLIGIMWRTRVPMRQMKLNADDKFRAALMQQLADQDTAHKAETKLLSDRLTRYEERLETQRQAYEAKLDFERISHEGELAALRHRSINLEQSLTMLLTLIESNPTKAAEAAKRVRELREKQEAQEAAEKTAMNAARIVAAGGPPAPAPAQPTP